MPDGNDVTVIDLNWIMLVSAVVLPLLVGLVTARLAHPGLKAVALAALAAVAGLVNELITVQGVTDAVDWSSAGANAVATFLIAVGLHFGLLKPTGITGANGGVQRAVPEGIGSARREPHVTD